MSRILMRTAASYFKSYVLIITVGGRFTHDVTPTASQGGSKQSELIKTSTVASKLLFSVLIILSIMASGKTSQVFRAPAEGEKLVQSTNAFALDLYKSLASGKDGNVFLGPASISIALGMTSLGAKNKTLAQMTDTLHLNDVAEDHRHESLSDLQKALKGNDDYILHTANRLYGQQGFEILESFLEATRKHYNADLKAVNFANEAEARQEINTWVEQQTAEKIKDLIPSGALDDLTRLVLVNAIYFKGDWLDKFNKSETKEEDFYPSPSNKVMVPMMHHDKKFMFGQSQELKAKALELPYKGEKLSMVILLPNDKDGLAELETQLTSDHFNSLSTSFRMMKFKTIVSLPKFKLEDTFNLKETLSALGMTELFDQSAADFSAIDGSKELYVSEVVHKAFINVDEEGSEAAAATGVIMMTRSLPRIMEFKADHPFLFMIRENETGAILFLGRMVTPPEAAAASGDKSEL